MKIKHKELDDIKNDLLRTLFLYDHGFLTGEKDFGRLNEVFFDLVIPDRLSGEGNTMTHKEKALQYFDRKFHCSQAVLAAFADECGLTEELALKLGACLGTGMRKGEVCGACTGALMVLGALYGQYDKADPQSRETANTVNDKMMNRFAEVSGSYLCNELLGCDIRTKEGIEYAVENKLFTGFCPKMVAIAVDILEEIIQETEKGK